MSQPIDYARADADVVRKKFQRRVVMFVIATVVVMVIAVGWKSSWNQRGLNVWRQNSPIQASSSYGWITLIGPPHNSKPFPIWTSDHDLWITHVWKYPAIGISSTEYNYMSTNEHWGFAIRYRTLFILAMIPWIITLIRLIRVWRVKHAVPSG